ncbi:MAG: hypothetical protein NVSMB3_14180 [Acidobacteriaceae bacterium]
MRRSILVEIHDHPAFPPLLRDLTTDALQALWDFGHSYRPILPRLRTALACLGTSQILDLCSGAGGPWLSLAHDFQHTSPAPLSICLTDKFPNREAFDRARATSPEAITFDLRSIDATRVPGDLPGFRTIFASFHHFAPAEAHHVLADAVHRWQGIAIFEAARPALRTMLAICFIPFLALILTPSIRPFRWSRLLFTYLIPIVPLVLWVDGILSCLRAYSLDQLRDFAQVVSTPGYHWEIGEERGGLLPVTYLIGRPESTVPAFDLPL